MLLPTEDLVILNQMNRPGRQIREHLSVSTASGAMAITGSTSDCENSAIQGHLLGPCGDTKLAIRVPQRRPNVERLKE